MSRKTKQSNPDENPEWTRADFARAAKFTAGVKLKDIKPGQFASMVGKRGPQKTPTKIPVSIRLSPEVVNHFKSKGPGWQSRIDTALRRIIKKAG